MSAVSSHHGVLAIPGTLRAKGNSTPSSLSFFQLFSAHAEAQELLSVGLVMTVAEVCTGTED